MNEKMFIEKLAKKLELPKATTAKFLKETLDLIKEEVSENKEIKFNSFGKFEVIKTNARIARNPRTGEKIKVKKSSKVKFRVFTDFAKRVK